jgi:hypothetical protein
MRQRSDAGTARGGSMKPGWWSRASTAERLAQIDAAIELGMTARQCAINCGCLDELKIARDQPGALQYFAFRNGRHFNGFSANKNANLWSERRNGRLLNKRTASIDDDRAAYLSGEPVDFWTSP